MKLAFVITAVAGLDLLHQREAEALRGAALDLALDRLRVERLADVLGGADPDDARQPEVDVDLGDDAHRGTARSATCARSPVHLAGLGVERRTSADGGRPARRRPRRRRCRARAPSSAARQASCTAPAAIHVMREAEAEPAEPTVAVVAGANGDVVRAELGARDLRGSRRHALADLGGGAVHLGAEAAGRAVKSRDARGA